jgi:hypothetical protein
MNQLAKILSGILLFLSGVFSCELFHNFSCGNSFDNMDHVSNTIEVEMEKAPSPWADYVFDGPHQEAPKGVEKMVLSGKWIRPISSPNEGYILAYKAEVALQKHEEDKFHKENSYEWPIDSYSVYFHFYFLDENGFCLKDIEATKESIQSFPSFSGIFIRPGEGTDIQQTMLMEIIPDSLVSRIKKIVYLPKFKTCVLRQKKNQVDNEGITKEKARLLQHWHSKIAELPPRKEWNVFHLCIFKAYGGDKTTEELNARAEEIAKQNLGTQKFNLNERSGEAPFR